MKIDINMFPYTTIRPQQQMVIDKINNNPNFRFYILEVATGGGKSALAKTICDNSNGGYIITSTKQLQDQYVRDFKSIRSIKGKSNYICNINDRACDKGACTYNLDQIKKCRKLHCCEYLSDRQQAMDSKVTVTSYAYFFTMLEKNSGWKRRDTLVLDECHLLEQNITSWAGLKLSLADIRNKYDLIGGELIDSVMLGSLAKGTGYKCHKNFIDFLWNKLKIKLENEMIELEFLNKKDRLDLSVSELNNLSKLEKSIESLTWLKTKLNIFIKSKDKDSWIIEPTDDEKTLIMEPIKVGNLFNQFINYWGINNVIFMSATILDIKGFCKELEINKEDVGIIKMESSFSPDKSPIFFNPCGSMSQKNINETLPNIINEVKKIIDRYPNSKGIIHTGNYKITKAIIDAIHSDRFIYKSGTESNEDLIKKHEKNLNPTILVSPSMHTGVDLKDDLSRFQICVKLPFLSLGDKRVKKKMELDNNWYVAEMFRTFVQSTGRSTRSEDDWSETYVLDSSFGFYLNKYKEWFPRQFLKRIRFKK